MNTGTCHPPIRARISLTSNELALTIHLSNYVLERGYISLIEPLNPLGGRNGIILPFLDE